SRSVLERSGLMRAVVQAWNWLAVQPRQRKGIRALQICLGLMLLFRVVTEVRFASYLWGPNGIGHGTLASLWGPLGTQMDQVYGSDLRVHAVLILMGAAAIGLVVGRCTRACVAVALMCFYLLEA